MQTNPVLIEKRENVLVLTLNREQHSNALSRATLQALGAAGHEVASDPTLRAVVITGAGERAFCAGADLKERSSMSETEVREQLRLYRALLGWIDPCPVPVIAAINGAALGGGLELALMCDLRVASASAVLGFPETSLGIIPAAEGTQRLPRIVGEAKAKEMILLGTRLSAIEAKAAGLIHRVSQPYQPFFEDVWDWILPIRKGAPIAQRAALAAIDSAGFLTLTAGSELELKLYEECLKSEDRREALVAFTEKRKPVFKGR